jgi:dihydroorotase
MNNSILIRNATLVNEGQTFEADLLARNGRIERIDNDIPAPGDVTLVDAQGHFLLPGMIDDQVHFREPGLTHKGDLYSESRAAIAGGITSFMEMPNTNPATTTRAALDDKYARAAESSLANYAFYFGATNDNIDEIRAIDPSTTCGLKVFMGASTGNMLVDDESVLSAIFRDSPVLIATHCESTPMIKQNLAAAIKQHGRDIPLHEHPNIRSAEACLASSTLAVELARQHQSQLHILHLSTEQELDLFEPGPMAGKSITAEVCVHFLHFCSDDYAAFGNRIKCNPAIKRRQDQDALISALKDGRLDILATDHAPHTAEEKSSDDYFSAPAGLPLVQDALLAALELVHDGHLSLAQIVEKTAHNPAQRFGVLERGYLREGNHADLVLVDLHSSTSVTPERVLARCGWSPFEGRSFRSKILRTWCNGQLSFDGDKIIENDAAMRLQFRPLPR